MWYPSLPCSLVQQISYICIHVECNVSITPCPFTLPCSAATMTCSWAVLHNDWSGLLLLSVCYLWRAFLQFVLSNESDDLTVQPPATETLVSKYLAPAIVDEWLDCGEELFQHLPMPMYVHTRTHTQCYLGKCYAIPFQVHAWYPRYGIIQSLTSYACGILVYFVLLFSKSPTYVYTLSVMYPSPHVLSHRHVLLQQ